MANRNFVFISYNHKDLKWAKWLQRRLEWYRLPAKINNSVLDSKYIRPVFRDRDILSSGVLNDELNRHLELSKYLVVICSRNSARSSWVNDEIKAFIKMGHVERIVPFIIDGPPEESFPPALIEWNSNNPSKNLLGISVYDDGKRDKEKAFVRLVAFLLDVEFDVLWRRHKRFIKKIVSALSTILLSLLFLTYWYVIPVKIQFRLLDQHSSLPGMEKGSLLVDKSVFSLHSLDTSVLTGAFPGHIRGKSIRVVFQPDRFYETIDTVLKVRAGLLQNVTLQARRDNSFAIFSGVVYDGGYDDFLLHPISGANVMVGTYKSITNSDGRFWIRLNIEDQEETKLIIIEKDGYQSFSRDEESPGDNLIYLMHKSNQ